MNQKIRQQLQRRKAHAHEEQEPHEPSKLAQAAKLIERYAMKRQRSNFSLLVDELNRINPV